MIDFKIPDEIVKLKEATEKFILENVIPREKDPRQDSHGPHDTLRTELNKEAKKLLIDSISLYEINDNSLKLTGNHRTFLKFNLKN